MLGFATNTRSQHASLGNNNNNNNRYFKQNKLTSFQRQLNLYGFNRLTRGPDASGYYHEYFLRDREYLAKRMIRQRIKGTKIKGAASPEAEPDFYSMVSVTLMSVCVFVMVVRFANNSATWLLFLFVSPLLDLPLMKQQTRLHRRQHWSFLHHHLLLLRCETRLLFRVMTCHMTTRITRKRKK